jgi:hypothetical protein
MNLSGYIGCNLTVIYNVKNKQHSFFYICILLSPVNLSNDVLFVTVKNIQEENVDNLPSYKYLDKIYRRGLSWFMQLS